MAANSNPNIRVGQSIDLKEIEALKRELETYLREKNYPEAIICMIRLHEIDQARRLLLDWQARLDRLEHDNKELKAEIEKKEIPPLFDGIYLKPIPEDPQNFAIIGTGQQRMEAQFLNPPKENLETLPGRQVWINGERQIVKIGEPHVRGEAVEVIENLKDSRLKVKGRGNEELVVEVLPHLVSVPIEVGDIVRIDSGLGVALEKLASKEHTALGLEKIPDVDFGQIGGLDPIIEEIKKAVEYPSLHRLTFDKYKLKRPKGVLLYGPPGCGKTMIAKAIANRLSKEINNRLKLNVRGLELYLNRDISKTQFLRDYQEWCAELPVYDQNNQDAKTSDHNKILVNLERYLESQKIDLKNGSYELERLHKLETRDGLGYFLTINGPEILNKFVGETESSIRHIFDLARKMATVDTPVVIFFDELESLFSRRGSGISSDIENTIVPQLLSEIDGMEDMSNVMIIGASNRFELIDPAVLRAGRFDVKLYIGRPDTDAAGAILRKYLLPQFPIAQSELTKEEIPPAAMIDLFIQRIVTILYNPKNYLLIYEKLRPNQDAPRRDSPRQAQKPISEILSGAMLESIIKRSTVSAALREINGGEVGLMWSDFYGAIEQECRESKDQYVNELFPTRDIGMTERFEVELHLESDYQENDERVRWFSGKKRPWLVRK